MDEQAALKFIDFLSPNGSSPTTTTPTAPGTGGGAGARKVSLCELTGRTLTSRFGYYGDEPVDLIHLGAFVT